MAATYGAENEAVLDRLIARLKTMSDGEASRRERMLDSRNGNVYLLDDGLKLAIQVALVTARPLLLSGPPGCGKSSVAPYLARNLGFRFLSYSVQANSDVSDFTWSIDQVERLSDAQVGKLKSEDMYVRPGILAKAFESVEPGETAVGALVLIDEIDKASTSLANSLLVAIGSQVVEVGPSGETVSPSADWPVLVVFTTNNDRPLPPAFLRRCIAHEIGYPSRDWLLEIAARHWPDLTTEESFRLSQLGDRFAEREVSTAEFLDLAQLVLNGMSLDDDEVWDLVSRLVIADDC